MRANGHLSPGPSDAACRAVSSVLRLSALQDGVCERQQKRSDQPVLKQCKLCVREGDRVSCLSVSGHNNNNNNDNNKNNNNNNNKCNNSKNKNDNNNDDNNNNNKVNDDNNDDNDKNNNNNNKCNNSKNKNENNNNIAFLYSAIPQTTFGSMRLTMQKNNNKSTIYISNTTHKPHTKHQIEKI